MLLEFMDKVVKDTANKMTAENVAMVIAPNLFLMSSGSRNRPQAMDRELKLAMATSKITLLLLDNRTALWTVTQLLIETFHILDITFQNDTFSANRVISYLQ